MGYQNVTPPPGGKISISHGKLTVPANPVIPFIRGDGTGPDIWAASVRVFDAAVEKAYGGEKKVSWFEVFAGETAKNKFDNWLPDETVEAFREYLVGIKGPLTTPVGGGIRSLNVALRQMLDLYVCLRPVQYFQGVPSPVKKPERVDMVIFRENTEDIYAGIDWQAGSAQAVKFLEWLKAESPKDFAKVRFGAEAIEHRGHRHQAGEQAGHGAARARGHPVRDRSAQEIGHVRAQGEHHEVHRGRVPRLGLRTREKRVRRGGDRRRSLVQDCRGQAGAGIIIKDAIADITLQQVLTRPDDFDVIATLNLNGDYLSDALAAQVGGIGIAPGGNINYLTGHAIFEATHGTAPKYADQDRVNPGSVVLSGEMMFRYLGWTEAADLILKGLNGAIASKRVTYDFARQMEGGTEIRCSEFGDNIIGHM